VAKREAVPADVMERLMASVASMEAAEPRRTLAGVAVAAPEMATPAGVVPIDRARQRKARRFSPAWLVAAASLALAFGAWWWARAQVGGGAVATASVADARDALAKAPGARTIAWSATDDRAAKGATGDVVWSATQQKGYMRFVGLAANDPTVSQYQLWIFDKARDQAYPVDGGVFDVSGSGEVIVPIDPKIHVDDATLFAVTVERPGGVVVSKRERIVVTAKAS
jgi:anti-sigma-K factor RskA